MTLPEWYALYEMHQAEEPVAGNMTRGRVDDLNAWADELKAKRNGIT